MFPSESQSSYRRLLVSLEVYIIFIIDPRAWGTYEGHMGVNGRGYSRAVASYWRLYRTNIALKPPDTHANPAYLTTLICPSREAEIITRIGAF